MEIAFDAIGIEISNETAFDDLTKNIQSRGEVSRLSRESGVLHGRCLKLGEGLEVWTVLYESGQGELFHADFRPGFRAKFSNKIAPWILTEFDESGESIIHGFIEDSDTEVLFKLQNLTEVGTKVFEQSSLRVGLCGLVYRAEVLKNAETVFWKSSDEIALNVIATENTWSLCGEILSFSALRNPYSGSDLFWIYVNLGEMNLEILVSQKALKGKSLQVGGFISAEVWLQGHILNEKNPQSSYEGVDFSIRTVDFWKKFKRNN